jgi:selenoprotein W-related protein
MAKLDITVEYCASCNYLPRALWMAGEILSEIQFEVGRFSLVPGDMGVFEWKADGDTVFSKAATGRFPELEELKEAIYARLE